MSAQYDSLVKTEQQQNPLKITVILAVRNLPLPLFFLPFETSKKGNNRMRCSKYDHHGDEDDMKGVQGLSPFHCNRSVKTVF